MANGASYRKLVHPAPKHRRGAAVLASDKSGENMEVGA